MRIRCRSTVLLTSTLLVVAAAATAGADSSAITFSSLLDEMVDRPAAARFPLPAYTCRQASSYDRASVTPDDPGAWQANNDRSFFIRRETIDGREESVMMDAEGPGCVVRIWATSPNASGNIRVYLDGSDKPVINQPAKALIGGDGLVGPPLSKERARGMNLYLPIPYAKHCKITYDRPDFHKTRNGDDLLYYQINYRTYEPEAQVKSFSLGQLEAAREQIAKLEKTLADPAAVVADARRSEKPIIVERLSSDLNESTGMSIGTLDKGGSIRWIAIRVKADDMAAALRSTVLQLEFDGQQTVWCPVGDFFGSGVGLNPYQGWWRKVNKDGWMECYWVMPYRKGGELTLTNYDKQDVDIELKIEQGDWQWDDRSMYFRTTWRHAYPIDTSTKHDWNYVEATGKGVYMGDTLCVHNPVETWWGEGDEKIYVDGERFPSHFGTGTEDYYGYAWCTPEFFESPFHSQPLAEGPRNKGHVTNTRVRLLDGIPFAKKIRMDMEVWHWAPVEVAYAATTHWYALPGAKANYAPMPELACVLEAKGPKPRKVEGAIEGESLKILERTGGVAEIQDIPQFKWSENKQRWWRDGKPGDRLVLELPVATAGNYRLTAGLTKAIDYGIVQLKLDDKPLGEPIDLVNDGVITKVYDLGTHQLTAGNHRFEVEITGSNPKAIAKHMFGVDYFKLDKAE